MLSKMKIRCQAAKTETPLLSFSNIRGLRGNLPQVEAFLLSRKPSILALSESRLDTSVLSSDVSVPNYLLHRFDSAPSHGLVVYFHDSLAITRLEALESTKSSSSSWHFVFAFHALPTCSFSCIDLRLQLVILSPSSMHFRTASMRLFTSFLLPQFLSLVISTPITRTGLFTLVVLILPVLPHFALLCVTASRR